VRGEEEREGEKGEGREGKEREGREREGGEGTPHSLLLKTDGCHCELLSALHRDMLPSHTIMLTNIYCE